MSIDKNKQSRSTAPVYRQFISFVIIAVFFLQHLLIISPITVTAAVPDSGSTVFINEIHYDNVGTDSGEFVEVAGPSGTNLTGWSIVLYNGSGGASYDTDALTGTIPSQQGGYGTVSISYPVDGIQNGSPDGIALVNNGAVVQFLCYEGSFAATGGPANGLTCTDILRSETSSTAVGFSLQLQGTGTTYNNFTWTPAAIANTKNSPNTGQTFSNTSTPTPTQTATPTPTPTATPTPTPTPPPVPVATHVVISQVYGGGGNDGAAYSNDFVELYNPTNSTFDLSGWTLQYASATGSGWDGSKQPLGGNINPGEYYLIGLGTNNSTIGQPLPAANISGELNLSGTAGKIALVGNGDSLSGTCPLNDTDVVDFVGYGTTASCSEGDVDAPAPSSTNAVFRKSNGSQDTNVNGSDFAAQSAAPRRTAPIAEIGPSVLNTDPRNNFTNSPRDSSLTITFSEPVNIDPQWFSVNCAVTGAHNDATIARYNDGKSYVITPNVTFQPGENCSVTIGKDLVHDQDLDDSAPNTDTLSANYSWSFTIATGAAPLYSPDVHLTFGNPTDAATDVNQPNNYLMEKPEFALSYNRDRGTPNWVSWHLDDSWVGSLARVDTFRPDPAVPSDWYRVQATDYFNSGFDRGHMVPNADRDPATSIPINQATFLMTNMIPQAPDQNQGPWANMENYLRTLVPANELYIIAGGAGTGGTGDKGVVTTTIADGKVNVPAFTWKVALILSKADGNDISRVSAATKTIAVIMPNSNTLNGSTIKDDDWGNFLVSIDEVEELTGYDFFENLPDAVENSVEAGINGINPPATANQTVDVAEDNAVLITMEAVGSSSLTYEIVGQPTNGSLSGTGANRTYTPNPNFNGTDSFTFRVSDGQRNSNTSKVTINVTAVNDNPTAGNDAATVAEDSGANMINVLGNDSSLPESNETLTITAVTQGANGSVTIVNDGLNVSYAPAANFFGTDSFTYTVSDGNGGAATATVSVNVTADNDAPGITSASISRRQNAVGSSSQIATVSDIDNAASNLTVSVKTAPAGIVVSNIANDNGNITATVAATCAATLGNNTVALQVSDGNSTATANLTVNVTPSNAPEINLKPFITLSSPNHKYQTISLNQMVQSATDDCNGNVAGNVVIERVTSDEAENGDDDGDTINDIVIGNDCKTVQLRAERNGSSNGRVYTVTLRVGDSSGNVTRADYKVFVPLGNQTPIDDDAVYAVNSNCP